MPWDADQYEKFKAERAAPFEDLFALIDQRPGIGVIDLGCGTGDLTAQLATRLPNSEVLGLDTSPQMLERAAQHSTASLRFEQRAIEDAPSAWNRAWDLVFSHAALQWIDDHHDLIPKVFALVAPGGQLAVQVPSNHGHLTHQLILELANEEPFASALGGWRRRSPVLAIDEYATLLHQAGATNIVVFEKVYAHHLESPDALVEWVRGTALVPYLERMDAATQETFLHEYRRRIHGRVPTGPTFYPFRRALLAATRPT